MNLLFLALRIALISHRDQFRRDGKTPYIEHPVAVADALAQAGESEEVVAAALLHDVLEDDPNVNAGYLLAVGIPAEVVRAVELLTKAKWTPYRDFILALRDNEIARKVKIADINHNLSDSPTERQQAKYTEALELLAA